MSARTRQNFSRAVTQMDAVIPVSIRGPAATAGFLTAAVTAETTGERAACLAIWGIGGIVELIVSARKRRRARRQDAREKDTSPT